MAHTSNRSTFFYESVGINMKQSGNQTIAMLTEIGVIIVAIALVATILITKIGHK